MVYVALPASFTSILQFKDEKVQIEKWKEESYCFERLQSLFLNSIEMLESFFLRKPLYSAKKYLLIVTRSWDSKLPLSGTPEEEFLTDELNSEASFLDLTFSDLPAEQQRKLTAFNRYANMLVKFQFDAYSQSKLIVQLIWELIAQKSWQLSTLVNVHFFRWLHLRGVDEKIIETFSNHLSTEKISYI